MFAEPNPSGTLVILLALDFQFTTVFKKNTDFVMISYVPLRMSHNTY
jgi:hypothetical protein